MVEQQQSLESALTSGSTGAALVKGQLVMADITLYVVDETKLDNLSAKNDELRTFYNVASALGTLGLGFFVSQFYTDKLGDVGWMISWVAGPICMGVALVFAKLGYKFAQRSASLLTEIKKNKATTSVQFTLKQGQ